MSIPPLPRDGGKSPHSPVWESMSLCSPYPGLEAAAGAWHVLPVPSSPGDTAARLGTSPGPLVQLVCREKAEELQQTRQTAHCCAQPCVGSSDLPLLEEAELGVLGARGAGTAWTQEYPALAKVPEWPCPPIVTSLQPGRWQRPK